MKRMTLQFRKEKETKGTFRYTEVEGNAGATVVGSIYIKKAALGSAAPPEAAVTVEDGGA